jgi:hypothetical protein
MVFRGLPRACWDFFSQNINTEALWFKRAAFYNGLKSKVGLTVAKSAALRINLH